MSSGPPKTSQFEADRRFATTHWSLVLAAQNENATTHREALAALCEMYWYPLYAYLRRWGRQPAEAQDLVQGFFARLLEKDDLQDVRRDRGRFRSFLLASLKNYLANQRAYHRAQKRGGGRVHLPRDFQAGEDRYRLEPTCDQTPDALFDRQWAFTLLRQAEDLLEREAEASGKQGQFRVLRPHLTGDSQTRSYCEAAKMLGVTEGAVKTAVHRLRRRFGELLREEAARTLGEGGHVDDEIRALFEALRR